MRALSARGGFTLIEVLVTVVVIAIVTGIGIASYRRFDSSRKVEAAAMDFGTFLRSAQKKADSGERPDFCEPDLKLEGYTVSVVSDTIAQEIPNCTAVIHELLFNLPHGAEFDNLFFQIQFLTKSGGVKYDLLTSNNETNIKKDGTSTHYLVSVSSGGAITVQKI